MTTRNPFLIGSVFLLIVTSGCSVALGRYSVHCELPYPPAAGTQWRHWFRSRITTWYGDPNHHACDLLLPPGESSRLCARFSYGFLDKNLKDESIEVWFQRGATWEPWGSLTTNDEGVVCVASPPDLPPGDYRVCMGAPGDGSTADGVVAVWPLHTEAVASDLDGTLTVSDWSTTEDVLSGLSGRMYPVANQVMNTWVKKGYRVVYLTGRPALLSRYSRQWLEENGFPRGPIHLADPICPDAQPWKGVRQFKADWLKKVQAHLQVSWVAAYGNARTDIEAYEDVGIPKEKTFIIGPYAGEKGTTPIREDYRSHVDTVEEYPEARPMP